MKTEKQTYKFRIVEVEYGNYLSYDEGPGSLSSVDATCNAPRVMRTWENMPESFGEVLLQGGHGLSLQEDSLDGRYEYSYRLERAKMGTDSWEWQGTVSRHEEY